jgi:hypothetical protein
MRLEQSLVALSLLSACGAPTSVVIEPLRVINWAPSSGAFCVDVNTSIRATFSDDIVAASLSDTTFALRDADGAVTATVQYDQASFTISLKPSAPLRFDRLYTVVAGKGLRGQEDGALPVDLDSSFQTVARSGCTPGVQCHLPSDCPGTQICANIGVCTVQCVTDKDCYQAKCVTGTCVGS